MGDVPWCTFVIVFPGDPHDANPQTPLFRSGAPHLGDLPQADQGGPHLPPCPSRACSRPRAPPPNGVRLAALYLFRAAQVGLSLRPPGCPRLGGPPPPRSPAQSDLRAGASPQSACRPRSPPARLQPLAVELSGTRNGARPPDRRPPQPRKCPRGVKKKTSATTGPRGGSAPLPLSCRGRRSTWQRWNIALGAARSFCCMKMKPFS